MWVLLLREDHGEQIVQHLAERLQVHRVARDGREGQLAALERVGNIVLFGEVGFLLLKIELAVSCLVDTGLLVLFQRTQQGLFVELADLLGDIVRNAGAGALLEGSVEVLTGQSGFLGGLVERRLNGGAAALQIGVQRGNGGFLGRPAWNRCRLRPASECRERAGSGRPDPLRQGRAGSWRSSGQGPDRDRSCRYRAGRTCPAAAAGERKDKGQRQQAQCERLYMFHDFLPFFFAKNAS